MLSLYEILKASKTGIAPDMWTALAGMNWGGADSGHEVKELTGIPPLSFRADGTPLLDYLISGNTVQNGTPTPSNPVEVNGVGVRTENLFNGIIGVDNVILSEPGNLAQNNAYAISKYIPVKPNTSYIYHFYHNITENRSTYSISEYDSNKNILLPLTLQWITENGDYNISFTTQANTAYIRINWKKTPDEDLMLSTGSTALPYEKFGYKIPISSGDVTTNIYLGSTQTTRQIKKLVLDGTENWSEGACRIGYRFGIPITSAMQSDTVVGVRSMCTHQKLTSTGNTYNTLGAYTITGASELLMTLDGDTRLASWKSWLAAQYATGTPVIVWYLLTTPQTATVNEPLMKIGDYADTVSMEQAQLQIPTNKGNTVIDVETTLKPSQMYIKYRE